MKPNFLLVLILISFFNLKDVIAGCGYDGYQRNPDGTYVFGQCND